MHERREKELSRRGQFSSSIARTRNLGGIDHGDLEVSLNYNMKRAPPSSTQFLLFATTLLEIIPPMPAEVRNFPMLLTQQ